uniref:THUMP domain-containing protein 1 n=1 Tax=Macaca fascicularis TaxID=9541 RepID=A0A7N9CXD0_MACFA
MPQGAHATCSGLDDHCVYVQLSSNLTFYFSSTVTGRIIGKAGGTRTKVGWRKLRGWSQLQGWGATDTTSRMAAMLPLLDSGCNWESGKEEGFGRVSLHPFDGYRPALGPGAARHEAWKRARGGRRSYLTSPARAGGRSRTPTAAKKRFSFLSACAHDGGPRPVDYAAWRREAQRQGSVCAGQARSALRRWRAPSARARATGHPHHLQHERAQVRGRGLQPAQRIRRRHVWARKEPEKLVHHILQDMYKTKKKKTRVILRMLPISGTCKAFLEDMKKYAQTFLEPWFKTPNKGTFQIVYKSRNNSHVNREEVIRELAGIVCTLNSENKVDLTNPQYTVVVEIIKAVCCLSVVKDYMLFRKYNLQEVVKSPKDPSQLNSKQGNGKEAKLESADKSDQNNTAEGKNNQQVPENTEELGQTKPTSNPQVVNEGGAKPELASQATEGSKSNENDLS